MAEEVHPAAGRDPVVEHGLIRGSRSLGAFLALYAEALQLNERQSRALQSGDLGIEFLDYDWRLNDRKG